MASAPSLRSFALALGAAAAVSFGQPAAAQEPELMACLLDKADAGGSGLECMGTVQTSCMQEIAEAGGNVGSRAGALCAAAELSAWLDAWAMMLEEAVWSAEEPEAALARFAGKQAETAQTCLRTWDADAIPMMLVTECVAIAYGLFLTEELRSSR